MVTMNEVAAQAGVAQSTASYVLNGRWEQRGISEETCQRVLEVARLLGYRPNRLARAMVTGSNPMFGLVIGQPKTEQVGGMLFGALREAGKAGFTIKLLALEGDSADTIESLVDNCLEMRLAGIAALHLKASQLEMLHKALSPHMPFAVLDSSFPLDDEIRVVSDDALGIGQAIDYLGQLGHRRFAFLGVEGDGASLLRQKAFIAEVERIQGAEWSLKNINDYWDIAAITEATTQIVQAPKAPTALLCAGDSIALIAMRTARTLGLSVPTDLSVVGFSDLTMARHSDPALTTISQPFEEMGEVVVRHLVSAVSARKNGEPLPVLKSHLTTQLTVRDSTGPVMP